MRCKQKKVKSEKRDAFFGNATVFTDTDENDFDSILHADHSEPASNDQKTIILSKKTKSNKQTNLYLFLTDYLLSSSHVTQCSDTISIHNFIGPTLPHSGHGDHKYFCMTILMFFVPFWSPTDLKKDDQSWDEAFNMYDFTPRQCQLMSNFNLKYECLDAHNDYYAQLHKSATSFIPFWDFNDGAGADIAIKLDQQCAALEDTKWEYEAQIEIASIIRTTERCWQKQVATMDKILHHLQWDKAKTLIQPKVLHELSILIQPGSAWRAAVNQKHQEMLDIQFRNMPSNAYQNMS